MSASSPVNMMEFKFGKTPVVFHLCALGFKVSSLWLNFPQVLLSYVVLFYMRTG